MYTTFRIQNFKGFKDLTFDNLARVNLIAGKNNTGKTSVLEAVLFHAGDYMSSSLLRDPRTIDDWFGGRSREIHLPSWNYIFNQLNVRKSISLEGEYKNNHWKQVINFVDNTENIPDKKVTRLFTEAGKRGSRELKNLQVIEVTKIEEKEGSDTEAHYYLTQYREIMDDLKRANPKMPITLLPSVHVVLPETDARRFSELDFSGQTSLILSVVKVVEPRLQSLKILYRGEPPLIYGDIGLSTPIPLSLMGEGVNQITSLILAMGSVQNGVLLIDEIENGLHYSILPDVWRAIDEASRLFNVQVFATTHSYEVIRAAHEVFSQQDKDYDFRLHRLERDEQGDISSVTYSERNLETAINMQLEVR